MSKLDDSISLQLKSIKRADLRRKSLTYGKRVTSKKAPPMAITFVADGWLDGYTAALNDVFKIITRVNTASDGDLESVGVCILNWVDETFEVKHNESRGLDVHRTS